MTQNSPIFVPLCRLLARLDDDDRRSMLAELDNTLRTDLERGARHR